MVALDNVKASPFLCAINAVNARHLIEGLAKDTRPVFDIHSVGRPFSMVAKQLQNPFVFQQWGRDARHAGRAPACVISSGRDVGFGQCGL